MSLVETAAALCGRLVGSRGGGSGAGIKEGRLKSGPRDGVEQTFLVGQLCVEIIKGAAKKYC